MTKRDRLIEEHLDLAHIVAHRVAATIPRYGMAADELDAEAQYLLVVAADRYDASRGIPFRQWAAWFMLRRLRDGLRRKALRDASHSQLPERYDSGSLSRNQEDLTYRRELRDEVQRALADLPVRNRTILELRYTEDLSHRSVGPHVNLRASRVSQLHRQALATLRHQLGSLNTSKRETE